jgi:hypothetical protein
MEYTMEYIMYCTQRLGPLGDVGFHGSADSDLGLVPRPRD